MPLPTTNLTLHLDASDTDKLFTTWVNGGAHTGTPADGNAVQAWSRETDGSLTPAHAAYNSGTTAPAYRSGTPLMLLPCLDFDGTNDEMRIVGDATVTDYRNDGLIFAASGKTIIVAFYAESITLTGGTDSCHSIIGNDSGYFNLYCRDEAGTKKLKFFNYDGTVNNVDQTITAGTTVVACARHDGTNVYLSVDGGSESSTASGASATWPNMSVWIGRANGGPGFFDGRIGEIACYNAALTGTGLTDAIAYFRSKWQGVGGGAPDSVSIAAMM